MSYIIELLIMLLSVFCTLNEAQYIEMPSDMIYPCQMNGQYNIPVDEPLISEVRQKRHKNVALGVRIENLKASCAAKLGISTEEIPEDLMNVQNPSPELKCLMACILKRLQVMSKNNLVSSRGIGQLADEIGNYNPLVTSVAIALSEQFNERLAAMKITDPCEAGFLINEYIAKEMRDRKMSIPY